MGSPALDRRLTCTLGNGVMWYGSLASLCSSPHIHPYSEGDPRLVTKWETNLHPQGELICPSNASGGPAMLLLALATRAAWRRWRLRGFERFMRCDSGLHTHKHSMASSATVTL